MKKLIFFLYAFFLCFVFCSCTAVTESSTPTELTAEDYEYIDAVYNVMDQWDSTHYDSGENHHIDKISFQDFDGTHKICFYINYPIAGGCGAGYLIEDGTLTGISPDIYDNDSTTRHQGCMMQTVINGTDWDYTATDEEKYEIIKNAYIYFLQNNIYDYE